MELRDSRRLTGANLLSVSPGAVIEVAVEAGEAQAAIGAWRRHARRLMRQLEWGEHQLYERVYGGGASLAITAPVDALYAACEVNEAAWEAAVAELGGPAVEDATGALERLRGLVAEESNPRLVALHDAAARNAVACLSDDEQVSVGLGTGVATWPVHALPHPDDVDWRRVHDVPVALVTGTNGKTTTVRMLAAIAAAAGRVAGNTSTDGVQIDGRFVLHGDYTGGEGARTLLRDRRVEIAVLENARGGILRRGLPVEHADVAYVTNVGTDHLGEYGIVDLASLAEVKLLVAHAVRAKGTLVANADDTLVAAGARKQGVAICWISVDPDSASQGRLGIGPAFIRQGDWLGRWERGEFVRWVKLTAVPATLGGAALHNVYNALGAMAVAAYLGLPQRAIVAGLHSFASSSHDNPGRGNLFRFGDTLAYADFAHNPEGMAIVLGMGERLPHRRSLVILGQAGDRDDASIRELVEITWASRPDRVILKEMTKYLRGLEPGEMVSLLERDLLSAGCPPARIGRADSEIDAVRQALRWAQDGDLLFLLLHMQRTEVLELLERLVTAGWQPGEPLVGDEED